MLLIHNAGADTSSWDGVIAALPPHLQCETVPLAGHRHSPRQGHRLADHRDAVLEVLAAGGPATVVGHCVGGAAALSATRAAPEHVRSLLLISPATVNTLNAGPWGRLQPHLRERPLSHPLTRAVAAILRTQVGRTLGARAQVGPWLSRSRAVPHTAMQLGAAETASRLALLLSDFSDFAEGDAPFTIPNRPPIHLLWGSRNRILPSTGITSLEQSLKPASIQIVAGAGHVLPLEVPDVVARAITRGQEEGP